MSKYSLISRYQKRSEMFVERILSLLMQIKLNDNFSKEVDNFQEEMVHAGVPGEDAYDCLMDFESSLADEYLLLSDGIYSAVLTALYHLWERDVKDLCKRMLRYYPVGDQRNRIITEEIVQKYQYHDLKGLLESLRVIFPEACFDWREVANREIPRSLLRGDSIYLVTDVSKCMTGQVIFMKTP